MSVGVLGNFYRTTTQFSSGSAIASEVSSDTFNQQLTSQVELPAEKQKEAVTSKQHRLLNFAYNIAKKAGLKSPEILQGIIYQESKAGAMTSYRVAGQEFGLSTNKRYYGISQIKLGATKDVIARYPYLKTKYGFHTNTDEEIIANLIMNDEFNIEVASLYLKHLSDVFGYEGDRLTAAYNKGPGGVKSIENPSGLNYVISVRDNIKYKIKNIKGRELAQNN